MFNWLDVMQQAQTRSGLEALTRQFQLSSEQTQRAMAAFLPAFAMGLQHALSANDPSRFFQLLTSTSYPNMWQVAGQVFSAHAQQEGRKLLDQLFGSDEISRRIAHQAANYTGIGIDTMQQLLPLLAGILAGSMAQWVTAQAQIFQSLSQDGSKTSQAAPNPLADLWSAWMKAVPSEQQPAPHPSEETMSSSAKPAASQEPQSPIASWNEMMEKGREMQLQYLASLQSIFAEAWKTDPKKP